MSKVKIKAPIWFWVLAGFGVLWNGTGAPQFISMISSTAEEFMARGLNEAQANFIANFPIWIIIAFAIGFMGGTIGSILLLLRKKLAKIFYIFSLIGYSGLMIGSILIGGFKIMGAAKTLPNIIVVLSSIIFILVSIKIEKKGVLV